MRTHAKTITGTVIWVTIFMCSFFVQTAGASGNWGGHGPLMGMGERLALAGVTEEQTIQLKAVLRKHRPALQPFIKQLISERRTLRALIRADGIDEGAIRDQSARIAIIEASLAIERARISQEWKAILTPEQIEKLQAMENQRDLRIDRSIARMAGRPAAK